MFALKAVHIGLAVLSVTGFVLRAWLALRGSVLTRRRWLRIAPHVLDTLLLASGVALAFAFHIRPSSHPWFAAKLLAIVMYILAGSVAMKPGRPVAVRRMALAVALAAIAWVVMAATLKTPWPGA